MGGAYVGVGGDMGGRTTSQTTGRGGTGAQKFSTIRLNTLYPLIPYGAETALHKTALLSPLWLWLLKAAENFDVYLQNSTFWPFFIFEENFVLVLPSISPD